MARSEKKASEADPRFLAPTQPSANPTRRATYFDAVALYEKGLDALQRRRYEQAQHLLQSVLQQYPEETDLHDRVRLYLNVCERHTTPQAVGPRNVEERLFASTLAINGGKYDEAISQLRLVRDEEPDNDHALYMLAVAHAQRGEHAGSGPPRFAAIRRRFQRSTMESRYPTAIGSGCWPWGPRRFASGC